MIDRSSFKTMESLADYLEENVLLSDFLVEDFNLEDDNCSPCTLSYGRGRSGRERSVPRLPKSALMLTVKLRAQKPWLACDAETTTVEGKVDNNEEFECREIQVKEAIMSTQPRNKFNFQLPKKGRGRAKALGTDLLHFPGGLQQKFFSQPRLPVWKNPADIYGDVNDYFKEWTDKGSLQRPVSEPNINTALDFNSQFPPLGSQMKRKPKKTEHIDVSDEQNNHFLPVKKRLPTGKDYHAYLARMEQKRHVNIRNTDPGVYDSTDFPPLGSDVMKGDGLVINVIPQNIKKTGRTVNNSGDGIGRGVFKTPSDIETNGTQFTEGGFEGLKYVPAEDMFGSSMEGSTYDLGDMSEARSIELSRNTNLQDFNEELAYKSSSVVPECTSRTLQFYLNAAESHNRRITEKQENLTKHYTVSNVGIENHVSDNKERYNTGTCTFNKPVDTLEQERHVDTLEQENNVDCLEKESDIGLPYNEAIASQDLNTILYQSDEESSSYDSTSDMVPDLVTSSASSLDFSISHMKAMSDSNIQILQQAKDNKLENQTISASSSSSGMASKNTSSRASSQSISAYSSKDSSNDLIQGPTQSVLNADGFTLVLDWKIHGKNVIQLEGLPLNADLTVVEEFVASYGTIRGREIKWADQQKYVRYKLDSIDACDFAVECLHDTDCLFPDSNSVLICSRV